MYDRIIEFILYADQLKQINRKTTIAGKVRPENSAEHSWHLCLMAILLEDTSNTSVDLRKVLKMLILHDLVEIEEDDTFLYDATRSQVFKLEKEAAERMFAMLPQPFSKEFLSLWLEFEEGETPESKFARSLDRLQPLLLNYMNEGNAWQKYGITQDQAMAANAHIKEGSTALWNVAKQLLEKATEKGYLQPPAT